MMKNLLMNAIRITADDLLHPIGLQRRRGGMGYALPALQWLLVGAVIGGCAALLFAPSSGEELRGQIGERLQSARDNARRAAANMRTTRSNNGRESRAGSNA
jgi:hypothetical protein